MTENSPGSGHRDTDPELAPAEPAAQAESTPAVEGATGPGPKAPGNVEGTASADGGPDMPTAGDGTTTPAAAAAEVAPAQATPEVPAGPEAVTAPQSTESPAAAEASAGPEVPEAPELKKARPEAAAEAAAEVPGAAAAAAAPTEPARSQAADEAAFLDLVARFHHEPTSTERLWPAVEDVDGPRRPSIIIRPTGRRPDGMPPDGRHLAEDERGDDTLPPTSTGAPGDPSKGTAERGPGDRGGAQGDGSRPGHPSPGDIDRLDEAVRAAYGAGGEAGTPTADDEDDHYVPPPAPPIPKMRPVTRWAIGSIALGMAILVVPSLIGLGQARDRDVAGVLLILGGVGTLVARMGDRLPTDFDGPDDGAVV